MGTKQRAKNIGGHAFLEHEDDELCVLRLLSLIPSMFFRGRSAERGSKQTV